MTVEAGRGRLFHAIQRSQNSSRSAAQVASVGPVGRLRRGHDARCGSGTYKIMFEQPQALRGQAQASLAGKVHVFGHKSQHSWNAASFALQLHLYELKISNLSGFVFHMKAALHECQNSQTFRVFYSVWCTFFAEQNIRKIE